jgi:hypothetical protein
MLSNMIEITYMNKINIHSEFEFQSLKKLSKIFLLTEL